jgi:hypothetical protein
MGRRIRNVLIIGLSLLVVHCGLKKSPSASNATQKLWTKNSAKKMNAQVLSVAAIEQGFAIEKMLFQNISPKSTHYNRWKKFQKFALQQALSGTPIEYPANHTTTFGIIGFPSKKIPPAMPAFADFETGVATILEDLRYDFYYGRQKGSLGTAIDQSGNDWDICHLIQDVGTHFNIPLTPELATIKATPKFIQNWTGIHDLDHALLFLKTSGTNAVYANEFVYFKTGCVSYASQKNRKLICPALRDYAAIASIQKHIDIDAATLLFGEAPISYPSRYLIDTYNLSASNLQQEYSPSITSPTTQKAEIIASDPIHPPERLIRITLNKKMIAKISMEQAWLHPISIQMGNCSLTDNRLKEQFGSRPSHHFRTFCTQFFSGDTLLHQTPPATPGHPFKLKLHYPLHNRSYHSDTLDLFHGNQYLLLVSRQNHPERVQFKAANSELAKLQVIGYNFFANWEHQRRITENISNNTILKAPNIILLANTHQYKHISTVLHTILPNLKYIDVIESISQPFNRNGESRYENNHESLHSLTISLLESDIWKNHGLHCAVSAAYLLHECHQQGLQLHPIEIGKNGPNTGQYPDIMKFLSKGTQVTATPKMKKQRWEGNAYLIQTPDSSRVQYVLSGGWRGGNSCEVVH